MTQRTQSTRPETFLILILTRTITITPHKHQLNELQKPQDEDRYVGNGFYRSLVKFSSRGPQRISPTTSEGLTRNTDFFEQV
jgi:hypothetical protein